MENSLLIFVSGIAILIGLFGSFLPFVPGVWLSIIGLLIFKYSVVASFSWAIFFITLSLVVVFQLLNYVIPIISTKKFGGSKYGVWGALVGLIVGLIVGGPLGMIACMFIGAFVSEYYFNKQDTALAFKSAFGTFIGYLISVGLELMLSCWIFYLFVSDMLKYLSKNPGEFF